MTKRDREIRYLRQRNAYLEHEVLELRNRIESILNKQDVEPEMNRVSYNTRDRTRVYFGVGGECINIGPGPQEQADANLEALRHIGPGPQKPTSGIREPEDANPAWLKDMDKRPEKPRANVQPDNGNLKRVAGLRRKIT